MQVLVYPHEPDCCHAEMPSADDRTLCGLWLEADDVADIPRSAELRPGRVSCPDCIAIVEFCRQLPKAWKAPQ